MTDPSQEAGEDILSNILSKIIFTLFQAIIAQFCAILDPQWSCSIPITGVTGRKQGRVIYWLLQEICAAAADFVRSLTQKKPLSWLSDSSKQMEMDINTTSYGSQTRFTSQEKPTSPESCSTQGMQGRSQ